MAYWPKINYSLYCQQLVINKFVRMYLPQLYVFSSLPSTHCTVPSHIIEGKMHWPEEQVNQPSGHTIYHQFILYYAWNSNFITLHHLIKNAKYLVYATSHRIVALYIVAHHFASLHIVLHNYIYTYITKCNILLLDDIKTILHNTSYIGKLELYETMFYLFVIIIIYAL